QTAHAPGSPGFQTVNLQPRPQCRARLAQRRLDLVDLPRLDAADRLHQHAEEAVDLVRLGRVADVALRAVRGREHRALAVHEHEPRDAAGLALAIVPQHVLATGHAVDVDL